MYTGAPHRAYLFACDYLRLFLSLLVVRTPEMRIVSTRKSPVRRRTYLCHSGPQARRAPAPGTESSPWAHWQILRSAPPRAHCWTCRSTWRSFRRRSFGCSASPSSVLARAHSLQRVCQFSVWSAISSGEKNAHPLQETRRALVEKTGNETMQIKKYTTSYRDRCCCCCCCRLPMS